MANQRMLSSREAVVDGMEGGPEPSRRLWTNAFPVRTMRSRGAAAAILISHPAAARR